MSGSGASNLGYSGITPFSNVNGNFVNKMNQNYSGGFSSNEIPTGGANGLSGIKDNVLALSGKVSNMSFFKGGRRKRTSNIKRKIKNITKIYNMRSKKRARTMKRKLLKKYKNKYKNNDYDLGLSSIAISGGRKRRTKRNRYMQKGGYSQYQNNLPMTPSYSVGGHLSAGSSGQAMPPPIHRYANAGSGNCTDNYNHFTGKGFPSRGH
jgi:hypothetical protein